jgi:uncharacterized protein YhaN
MRLRELQLTAFGPFTDTVIPFGAAGECDLHVVLGRNEAGKSTTLRAIDALLFGFPHRISDAQIHTADRLRVGAVIEAGPDSPVQTLARVRGNTRTLRDSADEVVDDAVMQTLLGEVDQQLYRRLFLVTQEELREGGEGLLSGGGELGVSVFGATLGAGNLAAVTARLKDAAAELFSASPNASKPRINARLRDYREHISAARALVIAPADYQRANELVATLGAERERQGAEIEALAARQAGLQRLASVSGLLARRRALQAELEQLGSLPELAAGAGTRREVVSDARARAASGLRERRARRDELMAQIERTDLSGLTPERDQQGLPLVERVGKDLTAAINAAADQHAQISEQALRAEQDAADHDAERAAADAAVAAAGPAPASVPELEQAAAALRSGLPGLQAAQIQREEITRQLERIERDAAALEPSLTLAQLGSCEPPAATVIERQQQVFDELAERLRTLAEERKRIMAQRDEQQLRLAVASATGVDDLATQLDDARTDRDGLMLALGRELDQGQLELARGVYVALQGAVPQADRFADALLAQGDRVAERARLAAEIEELDGQIERCDADGETLATERQRALARWQALWTDSGVKAPADPARMLRWHEQFTTLRGRASELGQQRQAQDERIAAVTAIAQALRERLAARGEEVDRRLPPAQLLERAQGVIDGIAMQISEREALAQTLDERTKAATEAHAGERRAQQALASWTDRWHELLAPLPLAGESSPARVRDLVTRINELAGLLSQLRDQQSQIAAGERELKQLDAELAALCAAAGVASTAQLPAIERAVAERDERRRQLGELEDQIVERGEGPIPELERELAGRGHDEIVAAQKAVEDDLAAARSAREELIERHTEARKARDGFDHGALAARERDLAEQQASQAGEAAWAYLSAKAAEILLQRAIEYHREHNASPIVRRAEELLRQLTAGSLQRLLVDETTPGQPTLVARRASGEELTVAALSDGTRDQLYLALRLAALEHHLSVRPPLPLLLDDILVHSDDERLAAALPALASIAERTQVILLTHHQHVATVAEQVLGDRVRVHRLGR